MTRRRILTVLVAALALIAAAALTVAWASTHAGSPIPQFPAGSGVLEARNGSVPPGPAGASSVVVTVDAVDDATAEITLSRLDGGDEVSGKLATGESLDWDGFSLRLCATWDDSRSAWPWSSQQDGADAGDRVYFVISEAGPAPECPPAS